MASAAEYAANAQTPLAASLAAGVDAVSISQAVTFTKYIRLVLPLDGSVFWVRADQVSQSALINASALNATVFNAPQQIVTSAPTTQAKGSLHYSTDDVQEEDASYSRNRVLFTAESEVQDLNQIGPNVMFIGTFEGLRFAFSQRGKFYQQSGLHHYIGDAVYSIMDTQVIDDVRVWNDITPVVSNSLPLWLGLGSNFTLYPSYLVPENLPPPYGVVHIRPDSTTAMQPTPLIDAMGNHWQLTSERVKVTLYGARNFNALDFQDLVNAHSMNTGNFGILNMPIVRDEKVTQRELGIIAQKKTIEFEISYYQQTARNIAQQLIESAICTVNYELQPVSPYLSGAFSMTGSIGNNPEIAATRLVYATPGLAGVFLDENWNDWEPSQGTFYTGTVDTQIGLMPPNMPIVLGLEAGFVAPTWTTMLAGVENVTVFMMQNPGNPPENYTIAAPFYQPYISAYITALQALVTHIRTAWPTHPIVGVKPNIYGFAYGLALPWANGAPQSQSDPAYTNAQNWAAAGYRPLSAYLTWTRAIAQIAAVLPGITLSLPTYSPNIAFPWVDQTGAAYLNGDTTDLVQYYMQGAIEQYGQFFQPVFVSLNVEPVQNIYQDFIAAGGTLGFQLQSNFAVTVLEFISAFQIGLQQGARYFEIHPSQMKTFAQNILEVANMIEAAPTVAAVLPAPPVPTPFYTESYITGGVS